MEGQMPPFTTEEARSMALLFLQTAIDKIPPKEEATNYKKDKNEGEL